MAENPMYAYIEAFVDELARGGMQHVVICPGSRSTPLAFVFARRHDIKNWVLMDERSAAFFALGLAKSTGNPVALVCTSGTAAANFLPAIAEADLSRVPLIVLTADRPPELRDNGAPQAIDQLKMYGSYVRWFAEMALPEATNDALRYARTQAGRALATARKAPAGAVHLNMPFREPLVPAPIPGQPLPPESERDPVAWYGRPDSQPYVAANAGVRRLDNQQVRELATELAQVERGLIICGQQDDPHLAEGVNRLAQYLAWPVLADPLSHVRLSRHHSDLIIDNYDAFLRNNELVEQLAPEIVLRFGAMPVSKPVLLYLKRHANIRQIVVDGGAGWQEPTALASDMVQADPVMLCEDLCNYVSQPLNSSAWLEDWRTVSHITRTAIETEMAKIDVPFEGKVFAELTKLLPDGATLFAGNSMPIRDLDTFFVGSGRNIRLLCNRGANGIDGVVSSALGVGAATQAPLALVIGDLSFYHDMNGLLAAKLYKLNATIILLNNDGGGIFSFLPQAAYPQEFEQLFGTPHGLDFRPAAELYGAKYDHVTTWGEFNTAVSDSFIQPGLKIIEVPTQRDTNVTMHRQMWAAMNAALKDFAPQGSQRVAEVI